MCIIGVEVKHEVRKFMLNVVKMVGSPLTFRASALLFRQRCQLSYSFVVHPQRNEKSYILRKILRKIQRKILDPHLGIISLLISLSVYLLMFIFLF